MLSIKQAEYAEDQESAKSILTVHVLHRGIQTGAIIGLGIVTARSLLFQRKLLFQAFSGAKDAASREFRIKLLKSCGRGATVGAGLMAIGLPARMYGREDIEWKDRSWRLLGNESQNQVDRWTSPAEIALPLIGLAAGARNFSVLAGLCGMGTIFGLGTMSFYRLTIEKQPVEAIKPSGPLPSPTNN